MPRGVNAPPAQACVSLKAAHLEPQVRATRWHAIFHPRSPPTISGVMEAIKDGATKRINRSRGEVRRLLEPRSFDRALRTVHEYEDTVHSSESGKGGAGAPPGRLAVVERQ